MKLVMEKIDQPTLFYLDGHYSSGMTDKGDKETPISEELQTILGAKTFNHVVVIDDARCFGIDPDYPMLEELKILVDSFKRGLQVAVENGAICITPYG